MKKILVWLIIWLTIFVSSYAYTTEQLKAANSLAKRWIINDHLMNPSAYNLDSQVLRQEIAAIARWVAGVDKSKKCKWLFNDLTDIKPNTWACVNVEPLVENWLIAKYSDFRPEDPITKTETLWMLIKSIGFDYSYDPNKNWTWQEQIVDFAVEKWIVNKFTDYNTFATRWWVFEVADYSLELKEEEEKKLKENSNYSDEASINQEFWIDISEILDF
jgi:hypothetical protein